MRARRQIRFSPDGDRLILAGVDECAVWGGAPLPDAPLPGGKDARTIAGWGEVADPDGDCTATGEDGKLTITVPGTVHDLNPDIFKDSRGRNAPRVLQTVEGDFTLQVKLSGEFLPGTVAAAPEQVAFHGGGILLRIDVRNCIRVERGCWAKADENTTWRTPFIEYWKNGRPNGPVVPLGDASPLQGRTAYLRLERRKGEVRARVSGDGRNWADAVAPLNVDLPPAVRVGVDAGNTSKEPFTVEFEELKRTRDAPEEAGASAKRHEP
jgi:regulation of enolase protein 1 (concanavalin A-like superfamily)